MKLGPFSGKLLSAGCASLLVCVLTSAETGKESTHKRASTQGAHDYYGRAKATHKTSPKSRKSRKSAGNWRRRGQQNIDPKRAREIQKALIREHYLDGKPSGIWDQQTQKAMERYQADNGWQAKTVPDARALIKLGLGPDHEHLLNPESAMTTLPRAAAPASTPASSADSVKPDQPQ